jgi:uncharacterized membrane protein SpoIIM required for sporulation
MDAPPAPPYDPWLFGGSIFQSSVPPPPMPVEASDPVPRHAFVAPARPDSVADAVRAYVRSSSLRVTGVLLGLMVAGLVVGYATGPHDAYGAIVFGSAPTSAFTVGDIFRHNLLVVGIPLILFPILFWAPAASSAVTGFSVGQLMAAWLALRLPGGLLAAALLPHGLVEIPAILLGGTMVWRIGTAAWKENQFGGSWNERASTALQAALPLLLIVVAALGLAAFIEVNVTPALVSRLAGF